MDERLNPCPKLTVPRDSPNVLLRGEGCYDITSESAARLVITPEADANGNRQSFDLSLFQIPAPEHGVPVFDWITDAGSIVTETQPIQLKSEFKLRRVSHWLTQLKSLIGRFHINLETDKSAWNNHSPTCMVPPVWNILASCEQQYLDLAPIDIDGDLVSCRWADLSEVGLAHYRPGNFRDSHSKVVS